MRVWRPKIVYGGGTTVTLELWQRLWTPASSHVGGGDVSAAGIPERFTIRRDELAEVTLRFWEHEWPALHAALIWMQESGRPADYWFDQADPLTERSVYLESPGPGEAIRPRRGEMHGTYEIDLTLRAVDGQVFDVRAYG